MARVSISEAARLVKVSRPTIYKMINSGKLSYTSVVKHGKAIKVIDTSELIRVFGSLDGVIDTVKYDVKYDVKVTQNLQVLTALVYMIYNIESLYLKLKTMVLKGLLRLEMSILIPFVRLCSFWSTSTNLLHHPIPSGGNSGKILILQCLSFPLRPSREFLNLPKIARSLNAPHH